MPKYNKIKLPRKRYPKSLNHNSRIKYNAYDPTIIDGVQNVNGNLAMGGIQLLLLAFLLRVSTPTRDLSALRNP